MNVDVSPTLISGGNDKPRTPIVVIGIDVYNLCTTGGVSRTLTSTRADNEHIPCVLIANSSGGGISGTLDASYYKGQGERQGVEREYLVIKDERENNIHRKEIF